MKQPIKEIKDSGTLIILEDGSKWEINSFDSFHTKMWMKSDLVEVYFGNLKNVSRNNVSVFAKKKL